MSLEEHLNRFTPITEHLNKSTPIVEHLTYLHMLSKFTWQRLIKSSSPVKKEDSIHAKSSHWKS